MKKNIIILVLITIMIMISPSIAKAADQYTISCNKLNYNYNTGSDLQCNISGFSKEVNSINIEISENVYGINDNYSNNEPNKRIYNFNVHVPSKLGITNKTRFALYFKVDGMYEDSTNLSSNGEKVQIIVSVANVTKKEVNDEDDDGDEVIIPKPDDSNKYDPEDDVGDEPDNDFDDDFDDDIDDNLDDDLPAPPIINPPTGTASIIVVIAITAVTLFASYIIYIKYSKEK